MIWPDWSWITPYLQTDITLVPFDKIQQGIPCYKDPVIAKCYMMPKTVRVQTAQGEWIEAQTAIYIRELPKEITRIQDQDKFIANYGGEFTVKSIKPYMSPTGVIEMWEVYV